MPVRQRSIDVRVPRSRRWGFVVATVVALATFVPAAAAQTSSTMPDDGGLLVPGPEVTETVGDDEGAVDDLVVEPVVAVDETGVDATSDDVVASDDSEAKVRTVMYALIGVAVLLSLLTVFYWWYTRPSRRAAPRPAAGGGGRRSRRLDTADDGSGTVGGWQTDSTSTR